MATVPPPPPPTPSGPPSYGTPPVRPAKPPWPAWKWGCLIAAIVGVVMVGGLALCCGMPAYQVQKMGGMVGAMGIGWLANVAQGKLDDVAQLTVGGRPEVDRMVQVIQNEVGDISQFQPDMTDLETHVDKTVGKAQVVLPLQGTKATKTCTVHLKQHPQMMWQVEDVTFAP